MPEHVDSHEGFESQIREWERDREAIAEYLAWSEQMDNLFGFPDVN